MTDASTPRGEAASDAPSAGTKSAPDWDGIEREYRAGQISLRAIASMYPPITEGAIRKRAKRDSWTRDLTRRVQQAVREKLVRDGVRKSDAKPEDIVEQAAERGAEVVRQHRKSLGRLHKIVETLTEAIETDIDLAGRADKVDDMPDKDRLRFERATKILGGDSAADVLEKLSRTIAKLIPLERQAFNLGADNDSGHEDWLDRLPE